jgi:exopolyphosphatase / guanosine-5'-triphosphate,3'-diphosphate pyrophosphatase
VIDLGSNSWRLVVYTFSPGAWWKRTDELYEIVRIGAGLAASGRLGDDAIERGLETLAVFDRFCRASGVAPSGVHAIATSAIRDAANGEEFLRAADEAMDAEIEVLSAEDEARYGYIAAVNTTTITDGVVLDLGGGSLQLIRVEDRQPTELTSFPLGAVRVSERFLSDGGPAKRKDIRRVRAHVTESLAELSWLGQSGPRLVGIGGAVRNLAAAAGRLAGQVDLGVQGFVLTAAMLDDLV